MSNSNGLRFPSPTELLKAWNESFQSKYMTALNLRSEWKNASTRISFGKWRNLSCLPEMLHLAWVGEWRDILFSGRGYFKTVADLRTLAFAVRETQSWEPLGRELDRAPKDFLLLELPEVIPAHYYLKAIPSVFDFCEASGMSQSEVLYEANSLRISDFVLRINKSVQQNRLNEETCEWIGKLLRYEPIHDPQPDEPYYQFAELNHLPRWRRDLLQFCRDAVLELAFRGYVADPLPTLYADDLLIDLVNDLVFRANEADRHSRASQSGLHSEAEGGTAEASQELTVDLREPQEEERKGLGNLPSTGQIVWADIFGIYRIEDYQLVLIETSSGIPITPGEKRALEALMSAGKDGLRLKGLAAPWTSFRSHVSRIKAKLKDDNIRDCIRTPEDPGPFQGEGYAIWP
ncbi:hypothetical protein J8F10_00260 [Gemmata sp. G18]|uniref:OmpR/PhoB-type domain-containing protein n=1 Tax=Gemmata palustris TaxID=2822762 RepID=A0ABS5BJ53_9BACT|nr:hypothetical protein [Gemmata palustris]MBP3953733.1 hypothetical protein [Gemmata palustris]